MLVIDEFQDLSAEKATAKPFFDLGARIALRVASTVSSRIILDEAGAEKLLGKGNLLANLGHGTVRAQAALVS